MGKYKFMLSIASLVLAIIMLSVGVFALSTVEFTVGGSISFTSTGIEATVSTATLSNLTNGASGKMQGFDIELNTAAPQTQMNTWTGNRLTFANNKQNSGYIEFKIQNTGDCNITLTLTNNSSNLTNCTVSLSGAGTITTGSTATCRITFNVTNINSNASIGNLSVQVKMVQA